MTQYNNWSYVAAKYPVKSGFTDTISPMSGPDPMGEGVTISKKRREL